MFLYFIFVLIILIPLLARGLFWRYFASQCFCGWQVASLLIHCNLRDQGICLEFPSPQATCFIMSEKSFPALDFHLGFIPVSFGEDFPLPFCLWDHWWVVADNPRQEPLTECWQRSDRPRFFNKVITSFLHTFHSLDWYNQLKVVQLMLKWFIHVKMNELSIKRLQSFWPSSCTEWQDKRNNGKTWYDSKWNWKKIPCVLWTSSKNWIGKIAKQILN